MPNHWTAAEHYPNDPMDQLDFFVDEDGRDMVDWVIRYEDLAAEMPKLCERLGVPVQTLPAVNGTGKPREYRKDYTPEAQRIIAERYPKFIERFGYEF